MVGYSYNLLALKTILNEVFATGSAAFGIVVKSVYLSQYIPLWAVVVEKCYILRLKKKPRKMLKMSRDKDKRHGV